MRKYQEKQLIPFHSKHSFCVFHCHDKQLENNKTLGPGGPRVSIVFSLFEITMKHLNSCLKYNLKINYIQTEELLVKLMSKVQSAFIKTAAERRVSRTKLQKIPRKRKITWIVVFVQLSSIPGSGLIAFLASGKVQEHIILQSMTAVILI